MVVKCGLSEELTTVLKQLVMNGSIRVAGTLLYTYCQRFYQVDEATAIRWMIAYFNREFPQQLQRHRMQAERDQVVASINTNISGRSCSNELYGI